MYKVFKIIVPLLIQFYCVLSLVNGHKKLFEREKWNHFKLNYNKTYLKQSDEDYHRSIFFANLGRIENHNRRADQQLESYRMAINHFSDMEFTDFARRVLKYKPIDKTKLSKGKFYHYKTNVSAGETSIDWRTKGVVSEVRDQGTCGSCWAFASVAAIESAIAIGNRAGESKVLPQLSEQNLIDCSFAEGNEGCLGGTNEAAYQYVLDAEGLDTRQSYPYEDRQGECRFNKETVGGKIKSYVEIFPDSEEDLLNAASKHVISVGIQATASFQLYSGGIFDDPTCDNQLESLNHAVAVIGYGSSDGQDYWLVKNSWGKYWGENGFGRIKRGSNHCGIASQASYPIV